MADDKEAGFVRRALGVFAYSRRALELVWTTSRPLTFTLATLTIVAGILPAAVAYISKALLYVSVLNSWASGSTS